MPVAKKVTPTSNAKKAPVNNKLKPGHEKHLSTPNISLSAQAQKFNGDEKSRARAEALAAKIEAYQKELVALRLQQQKTEKMAKLAQQEKDKLPTMSSDVLKYFSYIEQHCGQYLVDAKKTNRLLMRGTHSDHSIFLGHPRADRRPMDSDPAAQKLVDSLLAAAGFKALRSNGLFCTSDLLQAGRYGAIYYIFPKDGFSFTWSTKHKDLVLDNIGMITGGDTTGSVGDAADRLKLLGGVLGTVSEPEDILYTDDGVAMLPKLKKTPEWKQLAAHVKFWDTMDPNRYYNATPAVTAAMHQKWIGTVEALAKVMSASKQFLDWSLSVGLLPNFNARVKKLYSSSVKHLAAGAKADTKDKGQLAAAFIKKFGFTNANLALALKNGHEVIILGEYVAVEASTYGKAVKAYFLKK